MGMNHFNPACGEGLGKATGRPETESGFVGNDHRLHAQLSSLNG
jgi:hypothetical protein